MNLPSPHQQPWRVGVIGAGRIVERAHLPLLAEMPDVAIAGLFDPDEDRARTMARQYGIPVACGSLDALLDLQLDVVLVACPNHLHAATSIAAMEANIHVLCEKPMAVTSADARAMVATSARTGRELMIAFPNRFRLEITALRQAIETGQLGEIRAIRAGWMRQHGVPGVGTWFTRRALSGGGVLADLGSHMIDLALWLGGRHELLSACCVIEQAAEPPEQAAWYAPSTPVEAGCDVEVRASGFMVCEGPLNIFVEVGWDCAVPHDQTYLHVMGTRGSARIETLFGFSPSGVRPAHPLRIWVEGEPGYREVAGTVDLLQPYRDQWAWFLESLHGGRSLRPALLESLATVEAIESMYESADQMASNTTPS